jgi:hypothetical protein
MIDARRIVICPGIFWLALYIISKDFLPFVYALAIAKINLFTALIYFGHVLGSIHHIKAKVINKASITRALSHQ